MSTFRDASRSGERSRRHAPSKVAGQALPKQPSPARTREKPDCSVSRLRRASRPVRSSQMSNWKPPRSVSTPEVMRHRDSSPGAAKRPAWKDTSRHAHDVLPGVALLQPVIGDRKRATCHLSPGSAHAFVSRLAWRTSKDPRAMPMRACRDPAWSAQTSISSAGSKAGFSHLRSCGAPAMLRFLA